MEAVPERRFPIRAIFLTAALLPVLAAGVVVVTLSGPFYRGTYDNRPAAWSTIVKVHENGREGTIEFADGRTIRMEGMSVHRDRLSSYVGESASVVGDPADPATVEVVAWKALGRCGHALSSWNPFAGPLPRYTGFALATQLILVRPSDLESHVEGFRLRRSQSGRTLEKTSSVLRQP